MNPAIGLVWYVALGSAVGGASRFALSTLIQQRASSAFPVGTLIVNVTGSFMLGLLSDMAPPTVTVVGVGGLGAYTTFSSFARDAVALAELRRLTTAALYVAATCVLGLAFAAVGVAIANT